MRIILACLILCFAVGCGGAAPTPAAAIAAPIAPADEPKPAAEVTPDVVAKLASQIWRDETERIKAKELYVESDPEAWLVTAAARTARMLAMADNANVSFALPVSLQTDHEFFWGASEPTDVPFVTAGECSASYKRALEFTVRRLEAKGMIDEAKVIVDFLASQNPHNVPDGQPN